MRTAEEILTEEATEACLTPTQKQLVVFAMQLYAESYLAEYSQEYQLRQAEVVNELYAEIADLERELAETKCNCGPI